MYVHLSKKIDWMKQLLSLFYTTIFIKPVQEDIGLAKYEKKLSWVLKHDFKNSKEGCNAMAADKPCLNYNLPYKK